MIQTALDFLKSNFLEILLSLATVYAILTGKHKTAEELEKSKKTLKSEKKIKKLTEKQIKATEKMKKTQEKIEQIKEEQKNETAQSNS